MTQLLALPKADVFRQGNTSPACGGQQDLFDSFSKGQPEKEY